jgi:hypothetical protein
MSQVENRLSNFERLNAFFAPPSVVIFPYDMRVREFRYFPAILY